MTLPGRSARELSWVTILSMAQIEPTSAGIRKLYITISVVSLIRTGLRTGMTSTPTLATPCSG